MVIFSLSLENIQSFLEKETQLILFKRGIAHYLEGPQLAEQVLETTRKEAEKCDSLQGFQFSLNLGGATGSGLGSLLLSRLRDEFPQKIMSVFAVFPSEVLLFLFPFPYFPFSFFILLPF